MLHGDLRPHRHTGADAPGDVLAGGLPAWGTPGRPASFNRYAYVEGNPLKYVDPTGNFLFLAPLAFVAIDVAVGAGSSAFIASAAVTVMEVGLVTASFAGGWTVGSALAGNDAGVQEGQAGFEASIQLAVVGGMALDANIALRDGKVAIDYAASSFKSRPLPVHAAQLPEVRGYWAKRAGGATRLGVPRTNDADWRRLRDVWDANGYGTILSLASRTAIAHGRVPMVDDDWIDAFPGDAILRGERINMHHIGGTKVTVPLPASRHLDAHMPGGFRHNPGGPGEAG